MIPALLVLVGCAGSVFATPKLRLTAASIGPVVVASGANGPLQAIDAYNVGDGALALAASANVSWLEVSVGEAGNCSLRPGQCTPVRMALNTAGLAKGLHTGLVTISDPNAADAPQTVTVTVQVGGAVPDRMAFHVLPGGSEEQVIRASNSLGIAISTESGGAWLSVPTEGGGSFRFNYNYRVVAKVADGQAEGEYRGELRVFNSRLEEENRKVPVTLKVTSGPILTAPPLLLLRLGGGSAAYSGLVRLANRGGGSLTVSEARCTVEGGGEWLSAEVSGEGKVVKIKAQPAGLAQGLYKGSLELVSNAANSTWTVPVMLEIMAAGPPAIDYATITNLASTDPDPVVAPGMLVKVRGTQITTMEETSAVEAPYPPNLGGVQVFVNGREGAVLRTASDELWFQVPYEVEPGAALVQLMRDGQAGNFIEVTVVDRAPRIEPAAISPYAKALLDDGAAAMPAALGGRPAKAGDVLTLSLIGLGRTEPAVGTGAAPAEPAAMVPGPVLVSFGANLFDGGVVVEATSAGLIPGSPGRYAVKVTVPPEVAAGDRVPVSVTVGGAASNRLYLAIQ